jgi:hypothetical protein
MPVASATRIDTYLAPAPTDTMFVQNVLVTCTPAHDMWTMESMSHPGTDAASGEGGGSGSSIRMEVVAA